MKAKLILVATISFLFFPVRGFPASVTYYNADGIEISAEEYQEESRKYVKRYEEEIKRRAGIKTGPDPILRCIELSGMNQFIEVFPGLIDANIKQQKITTDTPEVLEKNSKNHQRII